MKNRHLMWVLITATVLTGACTRKPQNGRIQINVVQDKPAATYINGYRKTIGGQVLAYHSSHPDADSALLARANKAAATIEWQTDPLPAVSAAAEYQLVWLAGLEREGWPGKEAHSFDLFVNGEHWFTFKNLKDENAGKWKVAGKHGAELSFVSQMADRAGDLFGYMFMTVPKSVVKAGAPLILKVTGRDADNLDWYMVLEYTFKFAPTVRAEPALTSEGDRLLRLSFDSLQEGRSVEIGVEGMTPIRQSLRVGANIVQFSMPEPERISDIPIDISVNGEIVRRDTVWVKPVSFREIYLLPYSHNDIGYTDVQAVIEKKQWANLDEALKLIRETENYPWEARFHWNMEVMWPFESYLQKASGPKRQEVLQAVRNGSLGLNALYANVLTGLASSTETSHFTEYARRFSEQYKIPITTALVSDIPGFAWGVVPGLARSGVKYFASAPNSGDRIGHVLTAWGDKPFYWSSQSGAEKVLMWVAGASYSSFHEGDLTRLGDEKIWKLIRKLDDGGYPYQILQLPYTIGGDNGPPDPKLPQFVKKWNERYASPKLVIATHAQMFAEFEKRHGASVSTVQGDFTPYWEDGAASTAAETALNRRAADRLIQGEALWALRSPAGYPEREYRDAWKNVVLWDEHTWGAHNSVSDPDLPSVKAQWAIKRQFAIDAERMSGELLARLNPPAAEAHGQMAFDVFNTHSWPRTDLVLIDKKLSVTGDLVADEAGNVVPSQRLSTGELAVLAENVPPFSAKRIFLRPGKAGGHGNCRASARTIRNSLVAVSLDPELGVIESLQWGEKNIEITDRTRGAGLNQYLYVSGKDAGTAQSLTGVKIRVKEDGALVASLLVEAQAPGCRRFSIEYRVVDGIGRVEIINSMDKLAVRTKEAVHIAFPFDVAGGQLRYDVADSIVRPETDQVPGSCKNFFSIQSWADVSNSESGVTWTSPDVPLIEIGAITAEQPWALAARSSGLIYSYAMNNYWHTNYKADQEGPAVFRFGIYPHAEFKPEQAVRSGRESREPLIVMAADMTAPAPPSLFRLRPSEVVVSLLKPLADGQGWLIGIYNPTAATQKVILDWGSASRIKLSRSDISGHPGARIGADLKLPAWGTAFIRAEK